MVLDLINGSMEVLGSVATWNNVRRLYCDRAVQGVDWRSSAFFTAWGLWNCLFYPQLHLWWSFVGGLFICSGNMVWVMMALYFQEKKNVDR